MKWVAVLTQATVAAGLHAAQPQMTASTLGGLNALTRQMAMENQLQQQFANMGMQSQQQQQSEQAAEEITPDDDKAQEKMSTPFTPAQHKGYTAGMYATDCRSKKAIEEGFGAEGLRYGVGAWLRQRTGEWDWNTFPGKRAGMKVLKKWMSGQLKEHVQ